MNAAYRLMRRVGVDESLVGDLIEQRCAGRSALWLWRQTVSALAHQFISDVTRDPFRVAARSASSAWLSIRTVALGLLLPFVWMQFLVQHVVMVDAAWYPRTLNWMARSSPDIIWRLFVLLRPWTWTYMVAWCTGLCAISLLLVGVKMRQRVLVLTVLTLSQIVPYLPLLTRSVIDISHRPINPIEVVNLLWYAVFLFVATPLSIFTGGRLAQVISEQLVEQTKSTPTSR